MTNDITMRWNSCFTQLPSLKFSWFNLFFNLFKFIYIYIFSLKKFDIFNFTSSETYSFNCYNFLQLTYCVFNENHSTSFTFVKYSLYKLSCNIFIQKSSSSFTAWNSLKVFLKAVWENGVCKYNTENKQTHYATVRAVTFKMERK